MRSLAPTPEDIAYAKGRREVSGLYDTIIDYLNSKLAQAKHERDDAMNTVKLEQEQSRLQNNRLVLAREENERLVKILAKEREDAKAQLAEADRHAKKLEVLLEPYVRWDGKPSEVERLTAELAEARRVKESALRFAGKHLAEKYRLSGELALAREALGAFLKEHDIMSGNFGADVMDPKHARPDRWPHAAALARAALQPKEKI